MLITRTSILSGNSHARVIDITPQQLNAIDNRIETNTPIRKIVPHLSSDDVEFLSSGIVPNEFGMDYNDRKHDNFVIC